MKRITIALLILTFLVPMSSCKKYLETKPSDYAITSEYYSSKQEVDYALAGIYQVLRTSNMCLNYIREANAATDESYFRNGNVQVGPASYTNVSTNGISTNFWNSCYQGINYCNTFLDNIKNSENKGIDPVYLTNSKGEALFLRGYYYFMLAQWFGGVPLHLNAAVSINDGQLARATLQQTYDQIISDMTTAEGMLQNQTFATFGYSEKVTVEAVQGILARVCLHAAGAPLNDTKRYTDALSWANKVIAAGKHSLVPSFTSLWTDEAKNRYNNETIWEVGFTVAGTANAQNLGGPVGVTAGVPQTGSFTTPFIATDSGYCEGLIALHPRLYKAYAPGDLRRDRTIGKYVYTVTTTTIGKTYLNEFQVWERYPAKWRREEEDPISKTVRNNSQQNWPLLRYADVLLMAAEAENEISGPSATIYNNINLVRRRAYNTTNYVETINFTNAPTTNYNTVPPVTITGGGGTGATALAFLTSSQISSVTVITAGTGYTSAPTVTIGLPWGAGVLYAVNDQVFISGRAYRVTTAGVSTATAPTNTSGASTAATTGAVFTYAGVPATATAVLSNHLSAIDLTPGLGQVAMRQAIQDERYREFAFECLRYQDLVRWGILYSTVKSLANDIGGTTPGIPAAPAATVSAAIIPVNNITPTQILWPIPALETIYNKLIVQNPGY
ncbi:RagB/SusD family nutrient uptake outer membrane protein [Mucilaginibacter sp. HMF5004]|uniref:RagB/SusD family nutrient uptake outer membrane protein n=1 Tax=Mucilaginibacter rivuli TaxID=2857527 RepID=UPI001C5F1D63|nr:RagB/SusD family nutrient uptake outer membrane protein [Mucilaginibacter rivuli]MBW4889738.1 RagB/SusD family nutrient uptake outer membrane protein [Mucilaginibacter rivuli]